MKTCTKQIKFWSKTRQQTNIQCMQATSCNFFHTILNKIENKFPTNHKQRCKVFFHSNLFILWSLKKTLRLFYEFKFLRNFKNVDLKIEQKIKILQKIVVSFPINTYFSVSTSKMPDNSQIFMSKVKKTNCNQSGDVVW